MYRSFISLRYLVARPTNLIGVVGIFVAVGALILILSIMTGFLEESRRTIRGSLSDIIVEPYFHGFVPGEAIPDRPGPMLQTLRGLDGVRAAAPRLQWAGIITQSGPDADKFQQIFSSSTHASLLVAELVGVDVLTPWRVAAPAIALSTRARAWVAPDFRIQDEFDATELMGALRRVAEDEDKTQDPDDELTELFGRPRAPVHNPLFPFQPPPEYVRNGRPLASCIVGKQLFRSLGLARGDVLEIGTVVPSKEKGWNLNNRRFVIAGTFQSRDNEMDAARIYVARSELADFLGDSKTFSQTLVRLENYERDGERLVREIRETLEERNLILGGLNARQEVRTWEQFRINVLRAIENERVLMGIMLSLVLVVAGFTIFAILSMMVTEKRRDIGILCALGATPRGVLDLFLLIAFWDAIVGATLGTVVGVWSAIEIDSIERWLSSALNVQIFNRNVYLFDHIPSVVQPVWVGTIVLGAFLCSLLFAAIPAWRASRLDPLVALRYE